VALCQDEGQMWSARASEDTASVATAESPWALRAVPNLSEVVGPTLASPGARRCQYLLQYDERLELCWAILAVSASAHTD
jgi:hypothetical protein